MEDSGTTREIHEKREPRELKITMPRVPGTGWLGKIVATVVGVVGLVVVLSAVHLLPQLRNQFAQTTTATRQTVTFSLPKAQLEPAVLDVNQSSVVAEQQGLFKRIGNFFSGKPNSQQQVYQAAQR